MVDLPTTTRLPDVAPPRLRDAVRAVLTRQGNDMPVALVGQGELIGRLPSASQLMAGAKESVKEEAEDGRAAEYFQSLLELGYLVASADGLADEEREALALLVEQATASIVDRSTLRVHFADLEASCDALGRRERLGRVAANFEEPKARQEAISFAALVGIADGVLVSAEMQVLLELGRHFAFTDDQVIATVEHVAADIRRELGS